MKLGDLLKRSQLTDPLHCAGKKSQKPSLHPCVFSRGQARRQGDCKNAFCYDVLPDSETTYSFILLFKDTKCAASFFSYQSRGSIKQRMLDWASLSMRNSTANIFYSTMFLGLFTINQLAVATWGNMIPNPH